MVIDKLPFVVSPPINVTWYRFNVCNKLWLNVEIQFSSTFGKVNASETHFGNAPIAARSLKFVATAL